MITRTGYSEDERAAAARRYQGGEVPLIEALNEVASLANRVAGTPVALISVLDETGERVLANHRWNIATIESSKSFIPFLIGNDGRHLIIEGADQDERTRHNPLVTDKPWVRFWAGFPLITVDGLIIGALQILDQKPRNLTPLQLEALEILGAQAFRHLDDWRRIRVIEENARSEADAKVALKESEERFRDLFESVDDIIMTMLPNGGLVHLNRAGADHLGLPIDRRPKTIFDLVHYEDLPEFREAFSRVVRNAEKESVETTFLTEFGKRLTVQGTLIPKVVDRATVLVRVIFRDISERKKAELELGKARDAALESSRTKTRFLTNMSHELRTPMNIIMGMLELLLNSDLDEEQRDLASTAFASAESLLMTLSNILHVAQLESGGLSVTRVDFDPRSMLERLAMVTELIATEQSCRLVVDIDENLPLVLRGDVTRVRQVLTNLLSNAIKFNPGSEVRIRARQMDETETHSIVRFEVVDNGSGIPANIIPRLFEPFTQADDSYTRVHGGVGLGLATAKQLVELMGGVIAVETEEGEGSTFWFTLPFQRVSAESLNVSSRRKGFPGIRVVVIDRSETSRKILSLYFSSWDMDATFVDSPEEAIEAAEREAGGENPYRLMIFDQRLADRKGIDLAREISRNRKIEALKLAMMIPLGHEINDAELRDAGLDAVIYKPVEQVDLFERISSLFAADVLSEPNPQHAPDRADVPPSVQGASGEIPEGVRILLAEDKLLNQKLTLSQLRQIGLSADVAANGSEVLAALRKQQYDIILMDCQMPVMDGYEATMRIRENESDRHIHIIALTAHAVDGERERCISAGMDDYLSKPTRQHELAEALRRATLTNQHPGT